MKDSPGLNNTVYLEQINDKVASLINVILHFRNFTFLSELVSTT
jgi:hypothetical protein